MIPIEQAAAILEACGANRGNPTRAAITALISATAIRAAVDQVLCAHPLSTEFENEFRIRAQFLAIVDALETPTNEN